MHPLEALHTLQEIDSELLRIRAGDVTAKERKAADDALRRLAEEKGKAEKVAAKLAAVDKRRRRLELDLKSVESEIELLDRKLFGGEVTSAKELGALQERLDATRKRKHALEDDILACLDSLEQGQVLAEKLDRRISTLARQTDEQQELLAAALARWEGRRAELEAERERIAASVPSALVERYESLYDRLNGRPVARVENRTCMGCRVELPTSMRPPKEEATSRCPRCGRLLWWN